MRHAGRKALAILTALSFMSAPCSAADGPGDGPRLVSYCHEALRENQKVNSFRAGYCFAFIEGVLRGWEAAAYVRDAPVNYCIQESLTLGQIVQTIVEHLSRNPTEQTGRAEVAVIVAVQKAFPCGPAGGKPPHE